MIQHTSKILIITRSYDQQIGGMETHTQELAQYLHSAGYRVDVITPGAKQRANSQGINVIGVCSPPNQLLKYSIAFWRAVYSYLIKNADEYEAILNISMAIGGIPRLPKKIQVKIISVLHGTYSDERRTLLRAIRASGPNLKLVLGLPYTYIFEFLQDNTVRHSNKVIAIADRIAEELKRRPTKNTDKISVISNFAKIRSRELNNDDRLRVLFMGRVHSEKGVDTLLAAAKILSQKIPNIHDKIIISIVGDGSQFPKYLQFVRSEGLSPFVQMWGQIDHQSAYSVFEVHNVFVLPSRRNEGMPIALLEAMATGLLPIASNLGVLGKLVEDGVSGLLIEPDDAGQLAKHLEMLLSNKNALQTMAINAQDVIRERFEREKQLNKYLALIRSNSTPSSSDIL